MKIMNGNGTRQSKVSRQSSTNRIDDNADNIHRIDDKISDAVREKILHIRRIIVHPRHQLPCLPLLKKSERKPLQGGEHIRFQIKGDIRRQLRVLDAEDDPEQQAKACGTR